MRPFIAVDVEVTSLRDPRVIEWAAVGAHHSANARCRPPDGTLWDPRAIEVHGISPADVERAYSFDQLAPFFLGMTSTGPIVVYGTLDERALRGEFEAMEAADAWDAGYAGRFVDVLQIVRRAVTSEAIDRHVDDVVRTAVVHRDGDRFARLTAPTTRGRTLANVCSYYGVAGPSRAHTALDDAAALYRLVVEMHRRGDISDDDLRGGAA